MIAANELRVGNWVNHHLQSSPGKILPLQVGGINIKLIESGEGNSLYPIPLTPEILEKSGFEQSNEFDDTFRLGQFDVYYRKSYCEWTVDDRGDNEGSEPRFIKYVHQLQNIFYLLTGEELKIKEFEKLTK